MDAVRIVEHARAALHPTPARLSREDALTLFRSADLLDLGSAAEQAALARHGRRVTFVLNRQINPTNICVLSCKFCDFATKKGRANAYEMTLDEVRGKATGDIREVHIVGGLNPNWGFDFYLDIIRAVKAENPSVQVKAYTAVEIDFFARIARLPVGRVLERLREAGLDVLPGGGAEVFSERVRKALYPFKIGAPRWLEIHRLAHRMGIRSNATLLYGHLETYEERVEHLLRLRELQDETGGFLSFIPLAFQPGHTGLVARGASAIEDLKTVAVSRLVLDNVPHIKAYWVMLGEETAEVALHFGASDVDGTIGEERIAHAALAPSPAGLTRDRLFRLIRAAGRIPVERDALYNVLQVHEEVA